MCRHIICWKNICDVLYMRFARELWSIINKVQLIKISCRCCVVLQSATNITWFFLRGDRRWGGRQSDGLLLGLQ